MGTVRLQYNTSEFHMKVGDIPKPLIIQVDDAETQEAIALSESATATFFMRSLIMNSSSEMVVATILTKTAVITGNSITVTWEEGDFSVAGNFFGCLVIVDTTFKITLPQKGYFTMSVESLTQ